MSRVYRYEEIQYFTPPSPEVFTAEVATLRAGLAELHEHDLIAGAFIYGSATYGAADARSDIDLLVSTVETTPATQEAIHDLTADVYRRSGIPVDVSCDTEAELSTGKISYYQENIIFFLRKLAVQYPENIIGRNPVALLTPPPGSDLLQAVDEYLTGYQHDFARRYLTAGDNNPESALEIMLNLPHKLGRQAVSALMLRGHLPSDTLASAKKSNIWDAVERTFGQDDPMIADLTRRLAEGFVQYSTLVEQVAAGAVTKDEYDQMIAATVEANLPLAMALTTRLQAAYRQRISQNTGS